MGGHDSNAKISCSILSSKSNFCATTYTILRNSYAFMILMALFKCLQALCYKIYVFMAHTFQYDFTFLQVITRKSVWGKFQFLTWLSVTHFQLIKLRQLYGCVMHLAPNHHGMLMCVNRTISAWMKLFSSLQRRIDGQKGVLISHTIGLLSILSEYSTCMPH